MSPLSLESVANCIFKYAKCNHNNSYHGLDSCNVEGYIYMCMLSCFRYVLLFATLWTVAHQSPLFMGFSRQETWSWLPHTPEEDLPNPGIETATLMSPSLAGRFFFFFLIPLVPPWKPLYIHTSIYPLILIITVTLQDISYLYFAETKA